MRQIAHPLLAGLAAWALSIPLQFEAVLLSPIQFCLYHLPFACAAVLAFRFRHSLLGIATLLAASAIAVLRLLALPMFEGLWSASHTFAQAFLACCSIPIAAGILMAVLTPSAFRATLRPFSLAAGVALAWRLTHTFTDYSYYLHGATFAVLASLFAPLFLLVALPALSPRRTLRYATALVEPMLVVLIGWLATVPLYPIHGTHMRFADLQTFLYTVAAPSVLGAALFAMYNAIRERHACA